MLEGKAKTGAKEEVILIDSKPVEEEEQRASKIPYVVFIGQLNYATTQQDLEDHLRSHGIEGSATLHIS